MILAKSMGRLGNQLFQFGAVMKTAKKNETVVLVGFHQLLAVFPALNEIVRIYPYGKSQKKIVHKLWKLFAFLSRVRVIQSVQEGYGGEHLVETAGILPIRLFAGGFCQNPALMDFEAVSRLYDDSQGSGFGPSPKRPPAHDQRTCFVHVRRGDYLEWPTPTDAAALPISWYRTQMQKMRDTHPGISFNVYSDDTPLAESELGKGNDIEFSHGDLRDDFFAMSECDAGILSASTFSWWASFFAQRRGEGPFVAPKFWFGWKAKEWNPPRISAEFLDFTPVREQ